MHVPLNAKYMHFLGLCHWLGKKRRPHVMVTSRQWGKGEACPNGFLSCGNSPPHTPYNFLLFPFRSSHIQIQAYYFFLPSIPHDFGLCLQWMTPKIHPLYILKMYTWAVNTQRDRISKSHTSCVSNRVPASQYTPLLSCVGMIIHLFFRWENQGSEMLGDSSQGHIPPRPMCLNTHSLMGLGGEAVEPFGLRSNWQT